ncbi:MAG: PEPxxWA-CTERM sorting domain-containing protein [Pseudomonadota bacterium]
MKFPLKSTLAVVALCAATPSMAALTLVNGGTCSTTTPNPDATACAGAYVGNLLNNDSIGDINLALDALVGGNYTPDVLWSALDPTKAMVSGSGDDPTGTITFQQALSGNVILGVHFGDAGTGLGDRTIFYLLNLAPGTTSLALNTQGFSDAVFIADAVPEPETWAMMLLGFGAIGFAIRRGKARRPRLA